MMNLRNIPAIDELLVMPQIEKLLEIYNRTFVVVNLRRAVDESRQAIRLHGGDSSKTALTERILQKLDKLIEHSAQGSLHEVVNGTGVVLHTNLGRAPLGRRAMQNLQSMGSSYNNLEIDLASGERGSRYRHVEELLITLTGSEAGLVVNNNAAAVLLGLTALARDKEVIVSRGQLIEIGGAFRIPEVMKQSGARLVEVGTTNKTYLADFAEAVTENTALLFSAHTSNYKIVGFSQEVALNELVALGREKKIPVMHDLGSGILSDLGDWGLKDEPTVRKCVESGADIITFSGDKLLGGPQAGIIVGKQKYINIMKKNQLTRALRVDKLNIAALEGTLLEYWGGKPLQEIPVLRMLTAPEEELRSKAEQLSCNLAAQLGAKSGVINIEVVKTEDMVGGGAYPTYKLPGYAVQIDFGDLGLEAVARQIREMRPALLTRKQQDKMIISVRTLLEGDAKIAVDLICRAVNDEQDFAGDPGEQL